MRVTRCSAFLFAVLLLVVGCGPKSYTLQYAPKTGQSYTYQTKISGPQEMTVSMTMKPIKSEGGHVIVETRIGDMTMNGTALPPAATAMFKDMVMTSTYDAAGHVTDTQVSGVPAQIGDMMKKQNSGSTVAYPGKAVKVGDTWVGEADTQGQKLKMTYKFVKVDTVNGMEAAILEGTPDAGSTIKMVGPMKLAVEISTGMPITASFEGSVNGQTMKVLTTRT